MAVDPQTQERLLKFRVGRSRALLTGIAIISIAALLQIAVIHSHSLSDHYRQLLDNLCQCGGPAALVLWYIVEVVRQQRRARAVGDVDRICSRRILSVSALLAGGAIAYAVGQGIWTFEEWKGEQPFPSISDAFFILSTLLLLGGVLFTPRPAVTQSGRLRMFLDGLMIVMAAITFSWYFILGPTILQSHAGLLATAIASYYPTADILMLTCLVMVLGQSRLIIPVQSAFAIGAGLACVVVSDSVFAYQSLHDLYKTGSVIDLGWTVGYAFFALGGRLLCLTDESSVEASAALEEKRERALQMSTEMRRREEAPDLVALRVPSTDDFLQRSGALGLAAIPYLLLPAVVTLSVEVMLDARNQQYVSGVLVSGGALMVLLILRQVTTLVENRQLTLDLFYLNSGLEREVARRADEILAKDRERRAVETALTEREEQIHAIVKHLPVAIFSFDRNGAISLVDAPEPVLTGKSHAVEWGRILGYLGLSHETEALLKSAFAGNSVTHTILIDGAVIQLYLVPRLSEGRGVECVQALAIDATDRSSIDGEATVRKAA